MSDRSAVNPPAPAPGASFATAALDYALPETLIATRPAEPRDAARMLIVRLSSDDLEHRTVADLPEYLEPPDLVVFNDTAVAPARFLGRRAGTGGAVEGLFLGATGDGRWRILAKPSRRLRANDSVELLGADGAPTGDVLRLLERGEGGAWIARVLGAEPAEAVQNRVGRTPLPPYILRPPPTPPTLKPASSVMAMST